WTTIGVRPTCCRKASDDTNASSSSRSTAPPTLTTAKRAASSCEKRLRYWLISFVLPMPESRRTMVWRVWRLDCIGGSVMGCGRRSRRGDGSRDRVVVSGCSRLPPLLRGLAVVGDDPSHRFGVVLQLRQRHPLVRGMRLGDVAGAADQGVQAGRGE